MMRTISMTLAIWLLMLSFSFSLVIKYNDLTKWKDKIITLNWDVEGLIMETVIQSDGRWFDLDEYSCTANGDIDFTFGNLVILKKPKNYVDGFINNSGGNR